MTDLIIDMPLNDFNNKYNIIYINKTKIGYEDIIEKIILEYKKNPFHIDVDNITNLTKKDIRYNDKLWDDLINIENLIFKKIYEYFSLLSIDIIKSFIFLYYDDIFDCYKDYSIKNDNDINILNIDKKTFYLKLISFTLYYNTNIFNDVYYKIKPIVENNKLIII